MSTSFSIIAIFTLIAPSTVIAAETLYAVGIRGVKIGIKCCIAKGSVGSGAIASMLIRTFLETEAFDIAFVPGRGWPRCGTSTGCPDPSRDG